MVVSVIFHGVVLSFGVCGDLVTGFGERKKKGGEGMNSLGEEIGGIGDRNISYYHLVHIRDICIIT